ncbi:MAG: hypothetical protein JWO67_3261 [Streptosporangiaceae bacterium]|nr:hypothetical protein [Streptosporangiaceae bacterium]
MNACEQPTRKFPEGRTGTNAGYYAHQGASEVPCGDCRAANLKDQRDRKLNNPEQRRAHNLARKEKRREKRGWRERPDAHPGMACERPSQKHPDVVRTGTPAGYGAHLAAGEPACQPCKAAHLAKGRANWEAAVAAAVATRTPGQAAACVIPTRTYPGGRTGTNAGYLAHMRAAEPVCDACVEANRELQKHYYVTGGWQGTDNSRTQYLRHRLPQADYEAWLAEQGGGCAVCGTTDPGGASGDRFHVDHDHDCCPGHKSCPSCRRGLLCAKCNVGLGSFRDDPDRLMAAAAYLLTRKNVLEVANA